LTKPQLATKITWQPASQLTVLRFPPASAHRFSEDIDNLQVPSVYAREILNLRKLGGIGLLDEPPAATTSGKERRYFPSKSNSALSGPFPWISEEIRGSFERPLFLFLLGCNPSSHFHAAWYLPRFPIRFYRTVMSTRSSPGLGIIARLVPFSLISLKLAHLASLTVSSALEDSFL
jgi:hypothetical protein